MEYVHAVHDFKQWDMESGAYNTSIHGIATSVEDGYEMLVCAVCVCVCVCAAPLACATSLHSCVCVGT